MSTETPFRFRLCACTIGRRGSIEHLEHELEQLKDYNLQDTIKTASFLTDRYPRPEPEPASDQ
jgi:hypothetical protein